MKMNKKLSVLRRTDAKTDQKISELYPADWDMDAVFRKSYRKYRQEAGLPDENTAPQTERIRMTGWTRYAAAACLLLTVGITGVIGWKLTRTAEPPVIIQNGTQPIETVRPDETTQTTEPDTPRTTAPQQSSTASSPSETAATSEASSGAPGTESAQTSASTGASVTAVTSSVTTRTTPAVTSQSEREGTDVTQAPPPDDRPDDIGAQEPELTDTGAPEPGKKIGFQLVDDPDRPEIHLFYYFEDTTYYDTQPDFTVTLPDYTVTVEHPSEYSYKNTIENEQTGIKAYVAFHSGVQSDVPYRRDAVSFEETTVRGENAYLVYRPTAILLYWFDGRYLCSMHTNNGTGQDLIAIAEAMQTH